jgi:hypothetical protein
VNCISVTILFKNKGNLRKHQNNMREHSKERYKVLPLARIQLYKPRHSSLLEGIKLHVNACKMLKSFKLSGLPS